MKAFTFITEIFKKFPLLFLGTTLLFAGVGALGAGTLFTVGPLVDFFINPQLQNASPLTQKAVGILSSMGLQVSFLNWALLLVLFITLTSGLQLLARYSIFKIKYAVLRDIILGTFTDFLNAQWYFFSSNKQGILLNTFSRELLVVGNAFGAMALFFAMMIQMFFYLAVPLYISWKVTCISFVVAGICAIPFLLLGKLSYRWGKLNTSTANKVSEIVHESFSLVKIILGFGNQEKNTDKLKKAYNDHFQATIKSQTLSIAVPTLYRPFAVFMVVIALFTSHRFGVPLSEVTVLILGLSQVALSVSNLIMQRNSLVNFFPSYEQIKDLRSRAQQMKQVSGKKKFQGFDKEIVVQDVSFAYPGHSPVLEDINLCIPKGAMVAIVGRSGAGKSTLIDMIMGFYEPREGSITFDGIPLADFDIKSFRNRMGYVPQDSVLFHMSIRDNLLWANDAASDADIENVCRLAYADEFISKFSDGLDTLVGDRGVRLSGGQIQRIALARALLRKPELLILDEATSSLDTYSERLIQKAIENIAKKTTVIVIAHRLSTIKKADCVYVLEKGQIVETGTYDELLCKSGHFNSMVQLQELEVSA